MADSQGGDETGQGEALHFTVPRTVFEDVLAAASKGAYFNRHIRDGFPYQRVS